MKSRPSWNENSGKRLENIQEAFPDYAGEHSGTVGDAPVSSGSRGGFTLTEMLVTTGIIGTMAGLIVPAIASVKNAAENGRCKHNLSSTRTTMQIYTDTHLNGSFPHNPTKEQIRGLMDFLETDMVKQLNPDPTLGAPYFRPAGMNCPSTKPSTKVLIYSPDYQDWQLANHFSGSGKMENFVKPDSKVFLLTQMPNFNSFRRECGNGGPSYKGLQGRIAVMDSFLYPSKEEHPKVQYVDSYKWYGKEDRGKGNTLPLGPELLHGDHINIAMIDGSVVEATMEDLYNPITKEIEGARVD